MIAAPVADKIPAPELRGGARDLMACRDLTVLLDGPAGTGKTYAALYKLHLLLTLFPGAKALVARKANTSLAGSAMATYREMLDPREGVRYFGGNKVKPAAFLYPNGSELIVNGLDKPDKVKSWEFDIAFINEATECEEADIEFVLSRLRHGKLPYHQLIMDCNPDAPTHWLNVRCNEGRTTRLLCRHEDNPRFWDAEKKAWTPEGYQYLFVTLAALSGVRLARLLRGLWTSAEGTVYEDSYDRARNVVERFTIPKAWPRYLAIDFGYTNPFVCLWAARDDDGRLIIYRQLYRTKRLVEEHAQDIAIASGWFNLLPRTHERYKALPAEWADPYPREVIADHDAEGRATFERHTGFHCTPANKAVLEGIQAVASRFRNAGDGKPRLMIFRDSLIAPDPELQHAKKPTCLQEEPEVYVWRTGGGVRAKEEPVKEYDHALDATRYLCARFDLTPGAVTVLKQDIWNRR